MHYMRGYTPLLGMREPARVTVTYLRRNIGQVELTEYFDRSQSMVSRRVGNDHSRQEARMLGTAGPGETVQMAVNILQEDRAGRICRPDHLTA
jgi:hypothetical protein